MPSGDPGCGPAYRYQQSLFRCNTWQDVSLQQSHAPKRILSFLLTFEGLLPHTIVTQ